MAKTPKILMTDPTNRRANHATYMRKKRKTWTNEEVERNRELSKLRMQKKREKNKKEKNEQTILHGDTRQTRMFEQKEIERKKLHAEYKKKYRINISSQKKRRIREKDAAKKREKRQNMISAKQKKKNIDEIYSNESPATSAALKKMVYRAKKKLPKSPRRYAAVVTGLVRCVTPKRKNALKEQGLTTPKAKKNLDKILNIVTDVHQNLKGSTNKLRNRRREFVRHFAERLKDKEDEKHFAAITGIKRKYLNTCSTDTRRKRRRDALTTDEEISVKEFYKSDNISATIPDKKSVKKDLEEAHVMNMSLDTAYTKWKSQNPEKKLSKDKFIKLRPKNVKTQKHRRLFQCLCEYCENVKLKITVVNRLAEKAKLPDLKLKNEYEAVDAVRCPKQEETERFHKLRCIDGKCNDCGTKLLKDKLRPLLEIDDQSEVEWNRWQTVITVNPKTQKNISKRQEVKKSGTREELIDELMEELKFLSIHLFQAQWQQQQFATLNNNIPEKTVSITMDYAENYSCFYQNEIQGAHWSKDSVTVHPCICKYRCPTDGELVDEAVDIVSDNLNHESHAVHVFLNHVIQHLTETRQVAIDHAYIISDGAAAQYKSRYTFMDVSFSKEDYNGMTIERAYYGSRHGKNRCDGESGVLKSKATRDVKNRVTNIHNARTFYNSVRVLEKPAQSESGTCLHKRRTVLFVETNEIERERPERDCKTVNGTRKLHSVLGIEKYVIKTRRLSCFCPECLQMHFDQCQNSNYVDKWQAVTLKRILLIQIGIILY